MNQGVWGKQLGPALLLAVLALFLGGRIAAAQTIRDLPPPPPAPTPKPTPTPTPKDEDFDVIKVNSNLVMVPVSVVDTQGQALHGLQVGDFRLEEEGKESWASSSKGNNTRKSSLPWIQTENANETRSRNVNETET